MISSPLGMYRARTSVCNARRNGTTLMKRKVSHEKAQGQVANVISSLRGDGRYAVPIV